MTLRTGTSTDRQQAGASGAAVGAAATGTVSVEGDEGTGERGGVAAQDWEGAQRHSAAPLKRFTAKREFHVSKRGKGSGWAPPFARPGALPGTRLWETLPRFCL